MLARSKSYNDSNSSIDPNAVELVPAAKVDIEEKKRRIREELRKEGTKISGKKAKRLEKYIETKLKKDENRELLEKVAKSTTDTSLFQSSRKLGQGRETKRERLGRALKDREAGLDIDEDDEKVLFRSIVSESGEESVQEEDENQGLSKLVPVQKPSFVPGAGLKRPLDVDDEGMPILKKRKRRGGVKSKITFQPKVPKAAEELPWEGFSSSSERDEVSEEEGEEEEEKEENNSAGDDSEASAIEQLDEDAVSGSGSGMDDSENPEESSESESDDDEEDGGARVQRSSAFKTWANQQLNEALGYQPNSNTAMATSTQKI